MKPGFYGGLDLDGDLELAPDVCIVGSGAGGSVLAAGLAERGHSVVVLEEGGHHTRADFDMREDHAYHRLYQDGGLRTTEDRAIAILQGRTVGGGTVVNWTTSFRTPRRILDHWRKVHGIGDLDLEPHFDAVEERLGIAAWPRERVNRNNETLLRGCESLGWEVSTTRRNVRGCMDTGYCGMGCPIDAKQAMHITYLLDAVEHGAVVLADCRAERIEHEGRRVRALHARVRAGGRDGPRVVVRPHVTAVCGGAINTPALLLRSDLNQSGRVGLRTLLHPVVAVGALYEKHIEPFYGAPQSVSSHEHIDRGPDRIGYFLEAGPLHPMLAATAVGGIGPEHQAQMKEISRFSSLIAITTDGLLPEETGGTVTLKGDGRLRIDYPLGDVHMEAFRSAMENLARVHLAAGALEVRTLHDPPVSIRSEEEVKKLYRARWEPLAFPVFTAHQMGGAVMGDDPETSVVDATHRHRHLDDLFVVDGSVFPTGLGVNPSVTIYAMARRAVGFVEVASSALRRRGR